MGGIGYCAYKTKLGPETMEFAKASHREAAVRKDLGRQYFSDRESCDRETVSPFCLPKLTSAGKVEADVDVDGVIKRIRNCYDVSIVRATATTAAAAIAVTNDSGTGFVHILQFHRPSSTSLPTNCCRSPSFS